MSIPVPPALAVVKDSTWHMGLADVVQDQDSVDFLGPRPPVTITPVELFLEVM